MLVLGKRIKEARLAAGYTQEQLAEELGVSRGTIARYELGEIEPKLQNLIAMANLLHVSIDYLTGIEKEGAVITSMISKQAARALDRFIQEIRKEP